MNTFRTFTAALLTTMIIGLAPATPSSATVPASPVAATPTVEVAKAVVEPPAQLTLINATPAQADAVAEAIELFEAADLGLAPLEIEFHETTDGCRGNAGLYWPASPAKGRSVDHIDLCNSLKVIALHELGHAWTHHNLTDETRETFTAHWGLDSWSDMNDDHLDRGIERAAHTIAFTLNQVDAEASDGVTRYICGYELLTGTTLDIHTKIEC
jgi:hypothetical protein